jgi:hypothetical protein
MWAKIEERAEFVSKESGGFGASAVLYVGLLSAVGHVCVECCEDTKKGGLETRNFPKFWKWP